MQPGVPQISEAQAVFLEKFLNDRGTIISLAAYMDVPLVDMIDILSAPAVIGRINDAKILTDLKREIIAARIEIAALETLEEITTNKSLDPVERRRAAQTIIRATRPIRARSQSKKVAPLSERFPSAGGTGVPPVPNSQSIAHASSLCNSQSPPNQNRACEEAASPPIPPSQNRAHQEAAAGQTNNSTHTPNSLDEAHPSPPNPLPQLSPVACGLRPSQPDPSIPNQTLDDYDPETGLVTPIKNHTSKHKTHSHPPDPSQSDPPSVPLCLCPSVPSPIDNPWESHPFARAGRGFSSPSQPSVPSCLRASVPSPSNHDPP